MSKQLTPEFKNRVIRLAVYMSDPWDIAAACADWGMYPDKEALADHLVAASYSDDAIYEGACEQLHDIWDYRELVEAMKAAKWDFFEIAEFFEVFQVIYY